MTAFALNPDLPSSYQVPGVYAYSSKAGAAPSANNRRVLLLGYKTSAGTAQAGSPKRLLSEDDAVCGGLAKGSAIHRMFRDFTAQPESIAGEVWAMLMNAPSGTAQTRKITVIAAPSAAVLDVTSTAAAAPGFWTLWICGKRFDCQIALGRHLRDDRRKHGCADPGGAGRATMHGICRQRDNHAHGATRGALVG